jgi:arylsulfatase A-like enzyme
MVHSGAGAEQILGTSSFSRWVYQDVLLPSVGDFDASVWVSTSGLAAGASVELVWLTAAGVTDPAPTGTVLRSDRLGVVANSAPWTQFTGQFTAPAGAVAVRFTLMVAREPDGKGTAWFDDADFAPAIPAAPDTVPPMVTLTKPLDGETLSGTVQLEATASDNIAVAGVQFEVDGVSVGAEDTSAPYQLLYDLSGLPNGPHTVGAIARDAAGNTGAATPVSITVAADTLPPTVTLTKPVDGEIVSSTALLEATASDDIGVVGVQFQVDGVNAGAEDTDAPYQLTFDFSSLPNGPHVVGAVARDAAHNTGAATPVSITVQRMPELVVDPGFETGGAGWQKVGLSGRTVVSTTARSGTRSLQISVSKPYQRLSYQDVPVTTGQAYDVAGWVSTNGLGGPGASVTLTWLAGAGLPDPEPPASFISELGLITLNGTVGWTALNHRLTAPGGAVVARLRLVTAPEPDGSGSAWFDDLSVRAVPGGTPDVTPPSVTVTSPAGGEVLSGSVTISADASDDIAIAGVRFQVDGADAGVEDLIAPYELVLDTPNYPDGDHVLTAIARDPSGNTATAAGVPVRFANEGRPNIVLVLVDDLRFDLMPYLPLTTALLQPEAVEFSRAFVTTPECCPSRSSILTGLFSHNTGVLQSYGANGGAPRFNPSSTIATWLAAAGYRTGLYGKYLNLYHFISPAVPPGWSEFHAFVGNDDDEYYNYVLNHNGSLSTYGSSPDQYSTAVLTSLATQFITGTPATRPLFLYFTPFAPHAPAIPEPGDIGSASSFPAWRPPSFNESDVSDKPAWVRSSPLLTPTQIASEDLFHQRQIESVQSADRAVAALVAALQQAGRWDNTLFIFMSDNGLSWGEHRHRGKACLYEECVRVPLWIRAPGMIPATDTNLVAGIDLAPTMAAWAQITPGARVNGSSLLPLLSTPNGPWRNEVLLEYLGSSSPTTTFDGVRTPRFVYGEYQNGDRELYDLTTDPYQLQNVVADPAYSATVAALQAALVGLRSQ